MTRIRWGRLTIIAGLAAFWGGVLLLAGCEQEPVDNSTWRTVPPEQYEMVPAVARIVFVHPGEVERRCNMSNVVACCVEGTIIMPHPAFDFPDYRTLTRHELGHCPGGWPANHP